MTIILIKVKHTPFWAFAGGRSGAYGRAVSHGSSASQRSAQRQPTGTAGLAARTGVAPSGRDDSGTPPGGDASRVPADVAMEVARSKGQWEELTVLLAVVWLTATVLLAASPTVPMRLL